MKKELQESLLNRFPWARPDLSDKRSPWTLFGFSVGDGWYQLIWDMFEEFEAMYQKNGLKVDLAIDQIKEKFGVLVIHIHSDSDNLLDEVLEIREKYQDLSKDVCYDCGGKAYLRGYIGWWTTMCDECLANRIQQAKE